MSDPHEPTNNPPLTSDDVLTYLDKHPDFLLHHAEHLGIPPQADRVVISLVDRKMLELKDRTRQLESQLQQLIALGRQNDQLQARMHKLALTLISCPVLAELASAISQCFAEHFALDRCALRLWHANASTLPAIFTSKSEIMALAQHLQKPHCGPYANDEVMSWFPPTPVLQSFCQLALRDEHGQAFGLMVLASDDPQRFSLDLQTDYLLQMGEWIAAAYLKAWA